MNKIVQNKNIYHFQKMYLFTYLGTYLMWNVIVNFGGTKMFAAYGRQDPIIND